MPRRIRPRKIRNAVFGAAAILLLAGAMKLFLSQDSIFVAGIFAILIVGAVANYYLMKPLYAGIAPLQRKLRIRVIWAGIGLILAALIWFVGAASIVVQLPADPKLEAMRTNIVLLPVLFLGMIGLTLLWWSFISPSE